MANRSHRQVANRISDSSNCANHTWERLVMLQHEACNVNLQIEWQKHLIESLEPNVQKGIITPAESRELHQIFRSKQSELEKVLDWLLEKVQQIRAELSQQV